MQKAVGFLLLLAATLSVTIASPRRARTAEVDVPSVAVEQLVEDVQQAGADGAVEAAQSEVQLQEVVDTEVQSDQPAETSNVVAEVDPNEEAGATADETKPETALDAAEPNRVETGDVVADTVATSETEQEPATEAAAKPDEPNVVVKESNAEENSEPKQKRQIGEIVPQIKAFLDMLTEKVAELVGGWHTDGEENH